MTGWKNPHIQELQEKTIIMLCFRWYWKKSFFGTGSGNLTELEKAINEQAEKGYRLHTITTSNGGSKSFAGGDRIQATMVFEKLPEKE